MASPELPDGQLEPAGDIDGYRTNETLDGVTTRYPIGTLNVTGLSHMMEELQNGAVTRTFAYGLERISEDQLIGGTWTPNFYGHDGHGSTRFLTYIAGTVTDTYNYDTAGNVISSTGSNPNEFLFADEEFDPALGFYYMRARYYRPATGRFRSMDPIEGKLCCGLSWNPYIYTRNNPANLVDLTRRLLFARGALFAKVVAIGTVASLVRAELAEAYKCAAEAVASLPQKTPSPSGPGPFIGPPPRPNVGPAPSGSWHNQSSCRNAWAPGNLARSSALPGAVGSARRTVGWRLWSHSGRSLHAPHALLR